MRSGTGYANRKTYDRTAPRRPLQSAFGQCIAVLRHVIPIIFIGFPTAWAALGGDVIA
jgi:hypothetical protein